MAVTINGSTGITSPEVVLDNAAADGGQVVLKSSGYSNWNWDNYNGRLRAYYNATEYFTIDATGKVGIGTSSPAYPLEVNGNAKVDVDFYVGYNSYLGSSNLAVSTVLKSNANWNYDELVIQRNASNSTSVRFLGMYLDGDTFGSTSFNAFPCFVVTYSSNPTTGSTSTGLNASLYGYAPNTINFVSNTNGVTLAKNATSWSSLSDERLKNITGGYENALSGILQIRPIKFTWKSDPDSHPCVGVSAQSVQNVVPEAVQITTLSGVDEEGKKLDDTEYLSVKYTELVPIMIAAIQELKSELDATKAEVAALKGIK